MERISRLRERLSREGIDAYLVSNLKNIFYLSGFRGDMGYLLVTDRDATLIIDSRFTTQAKEELFPGVDVFSFGPGKSYKDALYEVVRSKGKGVIWVEDSVSVRNFNLFKKTLADVQVESAPDLTSELRLVKDAKEIEIMREGAKITSEAFRRVLEEIRPGRSEKDIAVRLEMILYDLGAEKPSFDFIVASGPRGAMPHARASREPVEGESLVVIDFGIYYKGYATDITRTVYVGTKPSEEVMDAYEVVKEAQKRAMERVRKGVPSREVDLAAREVIEDAGMGHLFVHSVGHGVGLDVHEGPSFSKTSKDVLESGNVITVEPGVYLEGKWGIRIEDMVLVKDNGCEVLTDAPRELIILS